MCEHRKLFFSRKAKEESKTLCEELAETLKAMGWATEVVEQLNGTFIVKAAVADIQPDLTMPEE